MNQQKVILRKIKKTDNAVLAKIIRDCFDEFDAPKEGTVYSDKETDNLYEYYQTQGAFGLVAELDGETIGSCGIYPTAGLPKGTAELVKFYIKKSGRSHGAGKLLMKECMEAARLMNYQSIYIESLPLFTTALKLYKKMGFQLVENRLGNTSHGSCDLFLLKDL
jgi:putative acetyltransferase